MHGQLAAKLLPGAGRLDGVYVTDQIGYGHVRSGQLLDITLTRRHPRDGCRITLRADKVLGETAQGLIRVVAQLGARYVRNAGIQQGGKSPQQAALRLPPKPQRMKLCRESTALTTCGTTVSS